MHKAIIVKDDASLATLNTELEQDTWWVGEIAANQNGSWLVVLTDTDPDLLFDDYSEEEDEIELEDLDELEYEEE